MATPIETNTQELREVLQQVYDLPDRSSGGSSEPDLVIRSVSWSDSPESYFDFLFGSNAGGSYGPDRITFNQESVVATYEKLCRGEDVKATLVTQRLGFNSWDGAFNAVFPSIRIAASQERDPQILIVRFEGAYIYGTDVGEYQIVEYSFEVDTANRTAVLFRTGSWAR